MVAVAGAIGQALELVAAPAGLQQARSRDFPEDVTQMLRLVAGDAGTLEQAVIEANETEESVREAAEFFVLQVCFTPGIDSYRVLAANREDAISRIREHYRLLVRWLHPDRNPDAWQTVYLDRVNKAWRDLRDPDERAEYDRLGPDHEAAEAAAPVNQMPMGAAAATSIEVGSGKRVSARTMRQLPAVVLSGLLGLAVVVLGLMYADYEADQRARQALPVDASEQVDPVPDKPPVRARPSARTAIVPTQIPADPALSSGASGIAEPAPDLAASVIESTPSPALAQGTQSVAKDRADIPATEPVKAAEVGPLAAATIGADASSGGSEAPPESAPPVVQTVVNPVERRQNGSAQVVEPATPISSELTSGISPGATPVAASGNRMDPMPGDAVDLLLEKFRAAYDEGNLIDLMALFTRDARNIVAGSKLLADDYRELFATSSARALSLTDMSWWREGEQVVVIARFNAEITPSGRLRARRIGGDIRFELRREDGEVRIARIRHQVQ